MRVGFIHNAFPVLTQTFIIKEMTGLAERGLDIKCYSLFRPDASGQAGNFSFDLPPITYVLDQYSILKLSVSHVNMLLLSPVRYISTWFFACTSRENHSCFLKTLFRFIRHKNMTKPERQDMLLHFFLAVPLARMIRKDGINLINSHFADAAASFALLCSKLLDIPYGITAHAYDIFTPQYNLHEKISNAQFVLTCTKFNKSFFLNRFPEFRTDKFYVFYHGIDTKHFKPQPFNKQTNPFQILSIGRLVNKKGFSILIGACQYLDNKKIPFQCRIIGDGPLRIPLENMIQKLGLESRIRLLGPVAYKEIKKYYNSAHIFALPCIVEKDGNRDGIPNVLAEAMAMGRPVISTPISGIPEIVLHDKTGLLVESKNVNDLAAAIESLYKNKKKQKRLGQQGRDYILKHFDSDTWLDKLYDFYYHLST